MSLMSTEAKWASKDYFKVDHVDENIAEMAAKIELNQFSSKILNLFKKFNKFFFL